MCGRVLGRGEDTMASLKDVLILGRMQTAAVEVGLFPLVAWLGGVPWVWLPFFIVLGLLEHFGAFGENSLSDLAYDKNDPAKQDHPLVAGRMTEKQGWLYVGLAQALAFSMFLWLVTWRGTVWTLAPFLMFMLTGYLYNHRSKGNKMLGGIAIAVSYASLALAIAGSWGHALSTGALEAIFLWNGGYVLYQIWVAGEVKEVGQQNEHNLLRGLGTRVKDGRLIVSADVIGLSLILVLSKLWTFLEVYGTVVLHQPFPWYIVPHLLSWSWSLWWPTLMAVVILLFLLAYDAKLLKPGKFDRPQRMKVMGLGEAFSYVLLPVMLFWILPVWFFLYLVLGPVVFFAGLNRVLYVKKGTSKSSFAPGV